MSQCMKLKYSDENLYGCWLVSTVKKEIVFFFLAVEKMKEN